MGYTWAQFKAYQRAVRLAAVRAQRARLLEANRGSNGGEGLKAALTTLERTERDLAEFADGRARA